MQSEEMVSTVCTGFFQHHFSEQNRLDYHFVISQDWLAMEHKFSGNMTDVDSVFFPNDIEPLAENDYAYCQV